MIPVPVGFTGRSAVLTQMPGRLEELTAGRGPDEVHRLLEESCTAAVEALGNQAELVQVYLACLARDDVRQEVGAHRPADLHALAALTAERASVSALAPVVLDLDVEVALYRWLWEMLGAPGPAAFVEEVIARRAVRLQLRDQPVAVVAARICEVPVTGLLPFEGPAGALADPPLSLDDVMRSARELSHGSTAWLSRRRGLEGGGVAPGAAERPYVMSGRALRWLLDRGIAVGPARLGRVDDYAKSVVEMLDRGEGTEPLGAHMNVVLGLAEEGIHLPLAEELVVLAWLCEEYDVFVDLEVFLDVRDRAMRGEFDPG